MGGHFDLQNGDYAMIPDDFDSDMFGFAISVVGMAICAVGAGIWSLFA